MLWRIELILGCGGDGVTVVAGAAAAAAVVVVVGGPRPRWCESMHYRSIVIITGDAETRFITTDRFP